MSNKKKIAIVLCVILGVIANIMIFKYINIGTAQSNQPRLYIEFSADNTGIYELYDGYDESIEFGQYGYSAKGARETASFDVDLNCDVYKLLLGSQNSTIEIYDAWYEVLFRKEHLDIKELSMVLEQNDIESVVYDDKITIVTSGYEPSITINAQNQDFKEYVDSGLQQDTIFINIVLCALLDLIIVFAIKNMSIYKEVIGELFSERKLVFTLAKNDFKTGYAGSHLGTIWAFVQPIVTVVVYWFVFQVGLRSGRDAEYPFILWLMAGLVPWFYFSEVLSSGTGALIEYSYLVKKVVFKISILPVIKMFSCLIVHVFFVMFIIGLCWLYGYTPDLYTIQVVYYIFCTFVLALGIVYITSSVVVFFRDLSQIVNIILQIGIWVTPIMWDATAMLSTKYLKILKLNPVYYIVDGFRGALLDKTWFFERPIWTLYFWLITCLIFGYGVTLFKKLKGHFADVL